MPEKGYIICVDDDLALLECLWQQITDLQGSSHEVVMAKSAEEALGMIYDLHHQGKTVEMVISDLMMPGMTGDRFLEIVNARFPQVIKILLTGYTGLDSALYTINNANLDKYISKPWQVDDLQLTVSSLLRQFHLRRDNLRLLGDLQVRNLELSATLRDLQKANKQIDVNYVETLQSLATALEAKDAYTAGHSERVARWGMMIARKIGLSDGEVEEIRRVALLHDIGKIGMPERILNKPGALTREELELVKSHPVTGAQILQPIRSFHHCIPIVRHHHEWFNGRGYPDRVGGQELPLSVWIAATADAFDAMTSNRPYRRMQTMEFAFQQLTAGMGTQFNPECVKALVDLLKEPGGTSEQLLKAAAAGDAGACAILSPVDPRSKSSL
ncbi:MAG TPA: HD domain-containing phosphohydrolase [Patescibacteria group bacterium]|jgi:putative nucleotidyltransferase with HDIG domain|nr:HD domain-containing phosphohydrolase [Patescibacteria group bacterium]